MFKQVKLVRRADFNQSVDSLPMTEFIQSVT